MDKIRLTLDFLNKKFSESSYFREHPSSQKYRYEHSLRVANIGKKIALAEGFNADGMVVACLLHDISYCNDFNSEEDWINHGRNSASIARPFVKTLGFDKATEDDILYGIAIHVDNQADFSGERTPFAVSIGDADNIDRFDTYRIYETLKNEKFDELSYNEQLEICVKRIEKLEKYLKLEFGTKTGTMYFHDKVSFQLQFYKKLMSQLENSLSIMEDNIQ